MSVYSAKQTLKFHLSFFSSFYPPSFSFFFFSFSFIHFPTTSTKGLPTAKHWSEHRDIYNRMYFRITVSINSSEHRHIFLHVCTSGNVKVHWTFGSSDRSTFFWERKKKEKKEVAYLTGKQLSMGVTDWWSWIYRKIQWNTTHDGTLKTVELYERHIMLPLKVSALKLLHKKFSLAGQRQNSLREVATRFLQRWIYLNQCSIHQDFSAQILTSS